MAKSTGHLYQQLKELLMAEIDAGSLRPGDQIPSERELVERFQMSRMTVRHGLTELTHEGVLVRYQGKGTFVARPKIRQKLKGLTSFTEDMLNRGMKPGSQILSVQTTIAPYKARLAMGLPEEAKVIRMERLRLADDEPIALELVHLPLSRFLRLNKENLTDASLYALLEQRYGVKVSRATQTIEPAIADVALARSLKVSQGALLLLLERTTFDEQDEPVEFVSAHYRGDRYRFIVELYR